MTSILMEDKSASDDNETVVSKSDLLEELVKRQKREKKDLMAKFTALKHSINKNGNKKTKKDLISKMEMEEQSLERKHKQELSEFETCNANGSAECNEEIVEQPSLNPDNTKLSKTARRRLLKEQTAKEHDQLISESESRSGDSSRTTERESFNSILIARGLSMVDIAADGDCLFNAVAHQLRVICDLETTAEKLRRVAAETMRVHRTDFEAFLDHDKIDYSTYCDRIEKTNMWGGQLELKALSMHFKRPILVLRADGTETLLGDNNLCTGGSPLIILYLRHELDSGAHYNSTELLK